MSHHLKILTNAGLLAARRQGNSIFYRRALQSVDADLQPVQASLFAAIDAMPLAREFEKKIEGVYAERAAVSRGFFEKHAAVFAERQGQLCELSQYLPNLRELLDLADLPKQSRVMEVGPGEGELLTELAGRFEQVVALDSSEPMLARAQKQGKAKAKKIDYVHESLEEYEPKKRLDAVVLNMVLHHMSSPAQALKKLRSIIRPGGVLLLADLGPHHQEWVRKSCGDLWMGFDPEDLEDWAAVAGFAPEQSLYLGLKNGFQIQLKLFR